MKEDGFRSIPAIMWFNILSNYVLNFCVICSCKWIVISSVFKDIRGFVSFIILSHFVFFGNISKHIIFYNGKEIFQTVNSTSQPKLFQTNWFVIVWNFVCNIHLYFSKKIQTLAFWFVLCYVLVVKVVFK